MTFWFVPAIEDDIVDLMTLRDKPSGTVRITVSDHAYQTWFGRKLTPMLAKYPDIRMEFSIDNGLRNLTWLSIWSDRSSDASRPHPSRLHQSPPRTKRWSIFLGVCQG